MKKEIKCEEASGKVVDRIVLDGDWVGISFTDDTAVFVESVIEECNSVSLYAAKHVNNIVQYDLGFMTRGEREFFEHERIKLKEKIEREKLAELKAKYEGSGQ